MTSQHPRYLVNCSIMFTEVPLVERAAMAKSEGFAAVEFWWPWPDQPVPPAEQVEAFVDSIEQAGVQLVGLNFFAGDLAGPDCGVLSLPDRSPQFRDNVPVALEIGRRLGVSAFNALYGNRSEGIDPSVQDEVATDNLVYAASAAAQLGATVLVEAVSGPKPYPLRTAADVMEVVDRVRARGVHNIGFLCDLFHLASNGEDLTTVIDTYADEIAHVQIADAPGRGEPGSGELDLPGYLSQLAARGYDRWVGLEYTPTTATTAQSLGWLPRGDRSA